MLVGKGLRLTGAVLLLVSAAVAQKYHEANIGEYLDRLIRDDSQVLEAPAVQEMVRAIGARIVTTSGNPNGFNFSFFVLNDAVPKAFSGPGGYIYITTGLLGLCGSRDEVAAVLAHEVGHVNRRHQTKFMRTPASAVALALAMEFGGTLAAQAASSRYGGWASGRMSLVKQQASMRLVSEATLMVVNGMGLLAMDAIYRSYVSGDELTADALAVDYANRASFDGGRLADILTKVAGFSAPGVSSLPGWHRDLASQKYPKLQQRIQKIRSLAGRREPPR